MLLVPRGSMIHVLLTTKYASDWISDLSLATKQFIGIKLSSLALSQFVKYMYSTRSMVYKRCIIRDIVTFFKRLGDKD